MQPDFVSPPAGAEFVPPPAGAEALQDLCARAAGVGLHLDPTTARIDESGLDFVALHAADAAGTPWIVRAPRRPSVVAACATEAAALRLVAPHLPVAVPRWQHLTPALVAYPRLPGEPVCTYDAEAGMVWRLPDPADPPAVFLDDLADFLSALRAVPVAACRAAGLPVHDLAAVRADLRRGWDRVVPRFEVPAPVAERWRHFIEDAPWPVIPALIHGDLHPGHLLVDAEHRLTGVLDWTEAQVGDPTLDLVLMVLCHGPAALAALLTRLAHRGWPEAPTLHAHVLARSALVPLSMLVWALDHDSEVPVAPALAMIAEQASGIAEQATQA